MAMAIALAPPAPKQELEELHSLLGSDSAIGKLLGRSRAQIGRWRKGEGELRDDSVELIDGAWHAVLLMNRLVGEEHLPAAVHQRWPLLRGQTPAQLLHEEPSALVETLLSAVEADWAPVLAPAAADADDDLDNEITAWFAANLVPDVNAPAPVYAAADDDEDDDELLTPPPRLDDSWRGGRSASSARWFKR